MGRKMMLILLLLFLVPAACAAGFWVKGNTHAHTNESDGDSPPEKVAEWYKSHGFNFLVISDHDKVVCPAGYSTDASGNFILIPGEEVSGSFQGIPVHVNAIGAGAYVRPENGETLADTVRRNVEAVDKRGALCQVNHPNWMYAFDHTSMLAVDRFFLLEIHNAYPDAENEGDLEHISVELMWDILLSAGKDVYGVAADDAHKHIEGAPDFAYTGRGWIMVRVKELSQSEVLKNMRKGNFYASTGVELGDYSVNRSAIRISIKPVAGLQYATYFIGLNGETLREVKGRLAIYRFTGDSAEAYVRAKIIASDGSRAWTQPVRRKS